MTLGEKKLHVDQNICHRNWSQLYPYYPTSPSHLEMNPQENKPARAPRSEQGLCSLRGWFSGPGGAPQLLLFYYTWVPGVGVWELLSGVLASASAVASSLWVIGRGPAAPA